MLNGVWTHFLIKALRGDADPSVYEKGCLLAGKLQFYLNEETFEFLQKNTDDRKVQTPIQFGTITSDFVIADLNPVFEKRAAEKASNQLKLKSISMYIVDEGKIKDLEGFRKGYHFIPEKIGKTENKFVKDISGDIAKEEISTLSEQIKKEFRYTRKEMTADYESGSGWIETPDFDYSITVSQSNEDPSQYEIRRSIDAIKNLDMVNNASFNKVFYKYFDSLSFSFKSPINIEDWIDRLEAKGLDLTYNPANLGRCILKLNGLDTDIIITPDSLDLFFTYTQSPAFLIEAYKTTAFYLEKNKIHLLD